MNILYFFVNFFILNCLNNYFFVLKSFNINFNTILNILFTNISRIPLYPYLRCQEIVSLMVSHMNRKNQSNLWYKLIFAFFWKIKHYNSNNLLLLFIIVRNYKYSDLIFLHGVIKYDNWLYKNLKKILIEILFHILNIYYKKVHIFSMHREFK